MRKVTFILLSLLLMACTDETIIDYFIIKVMTNPLETSVEHIEDHDSAYIVIDRYTEKHRAARNAAIDKADEYLKDIDSKDPARSKSASFLVEATLRRADAAWLLVIVRHKQSFDGEHYIKLIKEHGLSSKEVKKYTDEKGVETRIVDI